MAMASSLNIPLACLTIRKKSYRSSMVTAIIGHRGLVNPSSKLGRSDGFNGLRSGAKKDDGWRVRCQDWSCGIPPPDYPLSTHELLDQFYRFINQNNKDELAKLLTDDCEFEDLMFYVPFKRKEGVLDFINKVTDAMGKNVNLDKGTDAMGKDVNFDKGMDAMGKGVNFIVERTTEGENYTASVIWHLAWKNHRIPYTSGCSFFEFERRDRNLLIKKIRGMEELPLKPGDIVLKVLKATTEFFNNCPGPAERILSSYLHWGEDPSSMIVHFLKLEDLQSFIFHIFKRDQPKK